jgi:hypothetical protein
MDEDEPKPTEQVRVGKSKNPYENLKRWCFPQLHGYSNTKI